MSTMVKLFAVAAAVVGMAMVGVGTAQAAPTVYTVPNYNFQDSVDAGLSDGGLSTSGNYPDMWYVALGDSYPYNYHVWNPTSTSFATAAGNGSLPGTAAGSQCYTNTATASNDIMLIPGNTQGTYGQAITTLQANMRYTLTVAIGSASDATIWNGDSIGFADVTKPGELCEHDDLYPTIASTAARSYLNSGTFSDISFSIASNEIIGNLQGMQVAAGDGLTVVLGTCAGTSWTNVRLISQNWNPMYGSGAFTWGTMAWSSTSGGTYSSAWTTGKDAVFEGNGGTVTVSTAVSANSLSFFNDMTMTGYTLSGSGTITLTGDAIITTGAGTDSNVGANGASGPSFGTYNNVGGGTNTIGCTLAGTAGMYKAGSGTLVLTGANTYTGGTTVGGGTLQIGNGGTTGSILGNVSNLANLAFSFSNTFTFGGVISGTGSVDILGSGKTIFTGANTYTGITTIQAGTLQIGNGGTAGSITGDVVNNAALAFNRSDTVTYGGIIYGTGGVTQLGSGKVILTGANIYSGVTTVQQGNLEIANSIAVTNLLNIGGANITGGELLLDYSAGNDPLSIVLADLSSGLITDSASTQGGAALSYQDTGSQIIIEPSLAPSALYWTGTGTWDNGTTASWSTTSGGSYNQTWAGGAGAIFEGTAGTVTVASAGISSVNSITFNTDGYTLTGGAITLTGTGGNITTGTGTDTINCQIAGSVGLTKSGSGTLVLTANNSYTGGTTISAGTLQIGNGGTTGSISGNVANNGTLAFNHSDSVAFTGNISGSGGVSQLGSGRVTLSGANSYTGVTAVSAGVLQLNASAQAPVLTGAGGANIKGTGQLVLDYNGGTDPAATVKTLLTTAYNNGSNSFLSSTYQIRSTTATSSIGLGWVDNTTSKQVTIMPAMYGDLNLDGTVGLSDLNTLLTNYGKSSMVWSQGDFNYDGSVGLADLNALLTNYGKSGPTHLVLTGDFANLDSQAIQALAGAGVTAVPEPSSIIMLATLLALGGAWNIRRRRRNHVA